MQSPPNLLLAVCQGPPGGQARPDRTPCAELLNWALVRIRADDFERLPFELITVTSDHGLTGEVLWAATVPVASTTGPAALAPARIGLAFPWAAVAPGVLVVRDVLAITTNALLMDEQGGWTPHQDAAYLTSVVYRLAWQAEVLRRIRP
jgi:hypothetical protein